MTTTPTATYDVVRATLLAESLSGRDGAVASDVAALCGLGVSTVLRVARAEDRAERPLLLLGPPRRRPGHTRVYATLAAQEDAAEWRRHPAPPVRMAAWDDLHRGFRGPQCSPQDEEGVSAWYECRAVAETGSSVAEGGARSTDSPLEEADLGADRVAPRSARSGRPYGFFLPAARPRR